MGEAETASILAFRFAWAVAVVVVFEPEAEADAASFLAACRAALLFSLSGSRSLIPSSSLTLSLSFALRSLSFFDRPAPDPLLIPEEETYDALLKIDGLPGLAGAPVGGGLGLGVSTAGVVVRLLEALERRVIRATSANKSEVEELRVWNFGRSSFFGSRWSASRSRSWSDLPGR
jgi:hypothetical protein